jgi:hypothetical protein
MSRELVMLKFKAGDIINFVDGDGRADYLLVTGFYYDEDEYEFRYEINVLHSTMYTNKESDTSIKATTAEIEYEVVA